MAFVSHRPEAGKVRLDFRELSDCRTGKMPGLRNLSRGEHLLPKHKFTGLLGHAGGKFKFLDQELPFL